jgi:hypothetical protein
MNSHSIRPPFPFPNQWKDVSKVQRLNNESFWNVPVYDMNTSATEVQSPRTEEGLSVSYNEENDDSSEYVLEVNSEWTRRLSLTIQRMEREGRVVPIKPKLTAGQKSRVRRRRKMKKTQPASK